jgi:hypothetical protein
VAQEHSSSSSPPPSSSSLHSPAASTTRIPLGPIHEDHSPQFATFADLPDLQGSSGDLLAEMRSRSGTIDSAGSGRRRRGRGVSVSESEIIRVLAGGCESCHSMMLIHNAVIQ